VFHSGLAPGGATNGTDSRGEASTQGWRQLVIATHGTGDSRAVLMEFLFIKTLNLQWRLQA